MIRFIKYDLVGFLQASRIPNLLIIGSTQYFALVFLTKPFYGKRELILSLDFFLLALSTASIAAAGYIINDYYDLKIDLVNRPTKVVVGTKFRRRLAMLAHLLLTLSGISLGFILNVKIGVIHIFSSFSLWYYSNSLRRLPIIGNIVISSLTSLTLLLVPVMIERHELVIYVYSLFAFSVILIREVIKDIEDAKGDAKFGVQSIPVIWGMRSAKVFIYLVIIGSVVLLVSFLVGIDNWLVRYYFMAMVPMFVWFVYRLAKADQKRQFSFLRNFTNVIILSGLLSMLMIREW